MTVTPEVLFVSPHADDVCLSLAGVCSHVAGPKRLLTVFSRSEWVDPAWPGPRGPDAVSETRRREDEAFCAAFGFDYEALGLPDTSVRHQRSWGLREPTRDDPALQGRLELALLAAVDAGAVALLVAPLGLGRHADHLVCARAVREVAAERSVPVAYYEDLPYAEELTRWRIALSARRLDGRLRPFVVRTRLTLGEKLAAAHLYASQCEAPLLESVGAHSAALAGGGSPVPSAPIVERLWAPADAVDLAAVFAAARVERERRSALAVR